MPSLAFNRAVLGGAQLDPATQALIAAMTVKPNAIYTQAINGFIVGLKANGLWSTIDWINGFGALQDAQAWRINWVKPSQVGSATNSPTYTVGQGYTFDGATNYVDTGFIASTMAVNMTASGGTVGSYVGTNLAANGFVLGANNTGNNRIALRPRTAAGFAGAAVVSSSVAGTVAVSDGRALTTASRNGTTSVPIYKAGANTDTITVTAGALPTVSVFIGGVNNAGALSTGLAVQVRGVVLAGNWTAAQQATFYTLAQACMTAVGAQL